MMLFGHLLHHLAAIHILNPMVFFKKPDAWIAWGTQFIIWMMVWGVLYALPYARETPFLTRLPLVGKVLEWGLVIKICGAVARFRKFVGWLAVINGVGVTVYTGLLLQSFPAVALWANPGVPLLFTVFVRFMIALAFIFYIINFLSRFTNALIVCIGAAVVMLMITSRRIKKRSIVMERVFVHNLRSRDIAAQVNGEKRPLYEGRLLDRDIHISEFEVPEDSSWTGKSLRELHRNSAPLSVHA